MNMSLLMVVQPLLDAGRNAVSGAGGKSRGDGGQANPFQALLKGQMAARQPEKQVSGNEQPSRQPPASSEGEAEMAGAKPAEAAGEGDSAGAAASSGTEDAAAAMAGEDVAILAQIMAAAAGAQIVPVEPAPADGAAELAGDADSLLAASGMEGRAGRKMSAAAGADTAAAGKKMEEGGDGAAYGKVQADVQESMKAPVDGPEADTAAVKASADVAASAGPAAGKPAVQAQPQMQPQVQPQAVHAMQAQQIQSPAAPLTMQADPAAARIMQQMGTPEWNQAVGQRVLWMVGQEQQSASLTLNPPELGPVRVVVSVSNNNATANFFSAQPDVRQALEGSLPRLREMLEGAGIQLGQAQVGAENPGNQYPGQASPSSGGKTAGATGGNGDAAGVAAVMETPPAGRVTGRGLVDTFA